MRSSTKSANDDVVCSGTDDNTNGKLVDGEEAADEVVVALGTLPVGKPAPDTAALALL